MWIRTGAVLAVLITIGAGLWFVKSRLDKLEATQTRLAQVEQMLIQSRNELAAERLARKMDAAENTNQYEKADWACHATVKQAVAGTRVKPVSRQEVIRYVETPMGSADCPGVYVPDNFRLRDVQQAGTDPH